MYSELVIISEWRDLVSSQRFIILFDSFWLLVINDLHYPAYYMTTYQIYKDIKCETKEIAER